MTYNIEILTVLSMQDDLMSVWDGGRALKIIIYSHLLLLLTESDIIQVISSHKIFYEIHSRNLFQD